jgi:UDP-N-acetylmuramate dehydrogenase
MNMAAEPQFRGLLLQDESMARHCSWRCGGRAELYYEPVDKQDLSDFLKTLDINKAITWLGLGSNLLVRDGGIKGVVIGVLNRLNEIRLLDNGQVYAECGVTCAKLARFCQKHSLADAEFFAGIPGTVGGALNMNAGAFGFETWQFVDRLEMMNRHGQIVQKSADQFEPRYRKVDRGADEWFVAGVFQFPQKKDESGSKIKELLKKRNASQPIGQPSCGSVFKNPKGDYAARLIQASGLKGYAKGGACVSEKHANFIINTGTATAAELEGLILYVQSMVKEKFDVELHTEVKIIGDAL